MQVMLANLPDHDVPRRLLQQGAVGSDGWEQCLSRAFAHSRPRVHAQLAQLGIQAQPQAVEGRGGVERPVQGFSLLLSLLLQSFLLPLQLLGDGLASLEEVVGNVPLWTENRMGIDASRGKNGKGFC